ncbi:MAG TPA: pentapeptide repeat-containing protein [bacterium]|nr:pentapeptide repeat-containing protein [bacterium]
MHTILKNHTIFRGSSLINRIYTATDVSNVTFNNCNIEKMMFVEGTLRELSFIDCETVARLYLVKSQLHGAKFKRCSLVDFTSIRTQMHDSEFNIVNIKGMDIRGTHFKKCVFIKTTFEKIAFGDTLFEKCSFRNCTFTKCTFGTLDKSKIVEFTGCSFLPGMIHLLPNKFIDCNFRADALGLATTLFLLPILNNNIVFEGGNLIGLDRTNLCDAKIKKESYANTPTKVLTNEENYFLETDFWSYHSPPKKEKVNKCAHFFSSRGLTR